MQSIHKSDNIFTNGVGRSSYVLTARLSIQRARKISTGSSYILKVSRDYLLREKMSQQSNRRYACRKCGAEYTANPPDDGYNQYSINNDIPTAIP